MLVLTYPPGTYNVTLEEVLEMGQPKWLRRHLEHGESLNIQIHSVEQDAGDFCIVQAAPPGAKSVCRLPLLWTGESWMIHRFILATQSAGAFPWGSPGLFP